MEFAKTGNAEFDALCGGGIPRGSVIAFNRDPGTYSSLLAMQYLCEGLKKSEAAVYIAYDHAPEHIRNQMKKILPEIAKYENFIVVDAYNPSFRPEHMKPSNEKFFIDKPYDLAKVSAWFSTFADELTNKGFKNIRWVFDSYTTLMLISESSISAIKLLRSLIERIHDLKSNTLILMRTRGVFSSRIETLLDHLVDGLVDFKIKELSNKFQRTARIRKLIINTKHSTEEVPYEVNEVSIVLKTK